MSLSAEEERSDLIGQPFGNIALGEELSRYVNCDGGEKDNVAPEKSSFDTGLLLKVIFVLIVFLNSSR